MFEEDFVSNEQHVRYVALLERADVLLQDMRQQDRLRPPTFNIFFDLGHAYREVSTHSALLAYLLDPLAGHAQGTLFLNKFFEVIRRVAERQATQLLVPALRNGSCWRCRKEVRLPRGYGQADIMLQSPDLMLIIENKIFAGDQVSQLKRYWDYLQTEARSYQSRIIVYLTPDGRKPTLQSLGENQDLAKALICLSYRENICDLVQSTIDSIDAISVAETLRQYATLVRRL